MAAGSAVNNSLFKERMAAFMYRRRVQVNLAGTQVDLFEKLRKRVMHNSDFTLKYAPFFGNLKSEICSCGDFSFFESNHLKSEI